MSQALDQAIMLTANALHVEPSAISASTGLGFTAQWDSLAHMRLVLALEERLGRQLDAEAIIGIATLQDVVDLLASEI